MPDWEAELAALLNALDVSFERDSTYEGDAADPSRTELDDDTGADLDIDTPNGTSVPGDVSIEQLSRDDDEVSAVRNEIEATLARVIRLTRTGQLDRALRDDVVFVLQALTRPCPTPARAGDQDEWQLASAAAVLHFCRVVMRLTHTLSPNAGL